jgi:hypothetical protein
MAYAVQFNGSNSRGYATNPPLLKLTTSFDIEITFAIGNRAQSTAYLLNKGNMYAVIYGSVANTIEFYKSSDTAGFRAHSAILIPDTKKHTVRYTYDGANFNSYLDGVLVNTYAYANYTMATSTADLSIASSGSANYFNGTLYHLKIGNSTTTLAEYNFSEGTGTTDADVSGNGYTLNLLNSTWVALPSTYQGSASMSASSSMVAKGGFLKKAAASLSAVSHLQTSGSFIRNAISSLSATSSFNAEATKLIRVNGNAALSSGTSLQASLTKLLQGSASLTATGDMLAQSTKPTIKPLVSGLSISGSRQLTTGIYAVRQLTTVIKGGLPMLDGQNFSVIAGNSLYVKATLTEQDGTPLNLDNITDIKWGFGDRLTGVRKNLTAGITIDDAANGVLTIHINADDTKDRSLAIKHELVVTDALGNVSSVLRGTITIEKSII